VQKYLPQILRLIDVTSCPEGLIDRNFKACLTSKCQMLGKAQTLVAGAKPGAPDQDHVGAAASPRAEDHIPVAIENTHDILFS
jgi:hypothetical protein